MWDTGFVGTTHFNPEGLLTVFFTDEMIERQLKSIVQKYIDGPTSFQDKEHLQNFNEREHKGIKTHKHTHEQTHTHTHTTLQTTTHIRIQTTNAYTHEHTHTNTHTHIHRHTQTQTHTYTHTYTQACLAWRSHSREKNNGLSKIRFSTSSA
jgi:hypothetical protein